MLAHGFPSHPRCHDEAADPLASDGADMIVPYLRGFRPTRFRFLGTQWTRQQAAIAHDLNELVGVLGLERPIVAGIDWGGIAARLVAMLWPDSVSGLVTIGGYTVLDTATMAWTPSPSAMERHKWYQWHFHGPLGRIGLMQNCDEHMLELWRAWFPGCEIPEEAFEASAVSFRNPDFVEVVINSYRHRYGLVEGDPADESSERLIASLPAIAVPTIVVDRTAEVLGTHRTRQEHADRLADLVHRRVVDNGHNTSQEDPASVADAIRSLREHVNSTPRTCTTYR